jgi:hypothetical protein
VSLLTADSCSLTPGHWVILSVASQRKAVISGFLSKPTFYVDQQDVVVSATVAWASPQSHGADT